MFVVSHNLSIEQAKVCPSPRHRHESLQPQGTVQVPAAAAVGETTFSASDLRGRLIGTRRHEC